MITTYTLTLVRLSHLSGWRGASGMSSVLTTMCDTGHLQKVTPHYRCASNGEADLSRRVHLLPGRIRHGQPSQRCNGAIDADWQAQIPASSTADGCQQ
jgi:hypothetical protein